MEKSSSIVEMYQLDIEELDKFIQQSARPNIKRQLEEQKKNLSFLLEQEKKNLERSAQSNQNEKTTTTNVTTDSQNQTFFTVNKYALDSGDKFVKVYLTDGFSGINAHPKENIVSKFTNRSFEVQILNWNKKNYKFGCGNLSKDIIPEGSYVKQNSSGLTIFLKKGKISDHWDVLEYKKPLVADPKEKDLSKDPNQGLMDMMKEMYENGDPEMKRIIAESWTKARSGEANNKFDI